MGDKRKATANAKAANVAVKERGKTGKRGARRTRLGDRELLMMGKGKQFVNLKPIKCTPYKGASGGSGPLFDEKQSKINKALGYW
jgi:hypothetical protein